jgi:hypothetical protein
MQFDIMPEKIYFTQESDPAMLQTIISIEGPGYEEFFPGFERFAGFFKKQWKQCNSKVGAGRCQSGGWREQAAKNY